MTLVKIETGSRIPPPEGTFEILFSGHVFAPDQDIFTIYGKYVDNELPQSVEWSKDVYFESPILRMAAMHHINKRLSA